MLFMLWVAYAAVIKHSNSRGQQKYITLKKWPQLYVHDYSSVTYVYKDLKADNMQIHRFVNISFFIFIVSIT